MAAIAFQSPELAINDTEAKALAAAVAGVAEHYPVAVDPKAMAWINLVMAAGYIYGPRFISARTRIKKAAAEKRKKREEANGILPQI